MRKVGEECGVFGIWGAKGDAARQAYYALFALQHRGQESCGIAVYDGEKSEIRCEKDLGLIPEVFTPERLQKLGNASAAAGHVRYSTAGSGSVENAQPLVVRHRQCSMALAHNGNISNAEALRRRFEESGAIFHGNSDTEVISYAVIQARRDAETLEHAVEMAMPQLEGAYSLVILTPEKLIAARDPHGFRPLCMGKTADGAVVFASESCALDSIGAEFVRDIRPGEIVVASDEGVYSLETHCGGKGHLCVFEFVYFARPDSTIEGASVHEARQRAGAYLALEHPIQADVVVGVPDSGIDAALGYARQSGIPYGVGFIKNRYIGRSFIQPTQIQRKDAVHIKLSVIQPVVDGKRVIIIDDSIVRGTTSARIVRLLREAGAKEVHLLVSSPPFKHPCYFGTDIKSREHLIACRLSSEEEIAKEIGVDSLGYLSVDSITKIAKNARCGFCTGCFTGKYPVNIEGEACLEEGATA